MPFTVSQFWTIYDTSVMLCGYILNGILVWLIFKRTAKELKVYSKILLQTCFIDFVLLTVIGVVQPIYVVRRGWNLLIPNGPLRTISHPWCYVLQASWFYMIYFSIITNCVPFIYRYLIICRMKTLSAFHYFLMLAGCGVVVAIYMILHTWSTYPHEEYLQEQNYSIVIELLGSDLDPSEFKIGLMMKAHSSKWALACAYISILPIVELSSTIMCNIVSNLADSLADSSGNIYMSVFLLIPFHWVPLLNPVVTIWVIKPYRNFFIRCGKKRIRPTSTFGATSHTATGPGGAASSALAIG